MAQKRGYEIRTTDHNGAVSYSFVICHSPADFLKHAITAPGEKAKPGKVYQLAGGASLTYKPVDRDYAESCIRTIEEGKRQEALNDLDAELDAIERGVSAIEEATRHNDHSEAESVVSRCEAAERRLTVEKEIRLRLSVNDDSHLTGETIYDDDVITSLGFDEFLNGSDYDRFCEVANNAGYSVSTPCELLYRFKVAQPPPMPDFGVAAYSAVSQIAALGGACAVSECPCDKSELTDYADLDGDVIDLADGSSVRIEAPRTMAALYAPAPGLSKRQQRRNAGEAFGVVRRAK